MSKHKQMFVLAALGTIAFVLVILFQRRSERSANMHIFLDGRPSTRLSFQGKLPPLQKHPPTPAQPFIFFHGEKTGGSTLREQVYNSARELEVEAFVPCYSDIPCPTFDLASIPERRRENIAIVAGHFDWQVLDELDVKDRWSRESGRQFSCFTLMREPVARFISYYYDRVYKPCPFRLGELSAHDVQWIFDNFVFMWGSGKGKRGVPVVECLQSYMAGKHGAIIVDEGPADALAKLFSGANVNKGEEMSDWPSLAPPRAPYSAKFAEGNADKCVIGIVERWDHSMLVLQHWFPWIDIQEELRLKTSYVGETYESQGELSDDMLAVIRRNTQQDALLYTFGEQRLDEELWEVRRKMQEV